MANYEPGKKVKKVLLLVDLDGSIANNDHREHLLPNWNAFHKECDKDIPYVELIKTIQKYGKLEDVTLIFCTGRTGLKEVESKTHQWMKEQGFENPHIVFRRPDSFLKNDVYKASVIEKILDKEGFEDGLEMIIIEDTLNVFDRFKKKFPHIKIHEVPVDMKNPENNPMQVLEQAFESMGMAIKNKTYKKYY